MHGIVCFVFYQSSVLVIEVIIIGDMSKKKKGVTSSVKMATARNQVGGGSMFL